jgi:N-acetylglucosaminyl-diphospho-decaprenol L-rhamnosyltransferase
MAQLMISAACIPIIIVSYRNPKDVVECLTALQGLTTDPPFDVYICENGGAAAFEALISSLVTADGPCDEDTANSIDEQMSQFVRVRHLRLSGREARVVVAEAEENFGYGGAINAWLRVLLTLPAWLGVWILNPDTQAEPRALAELVACSTARRKGMVGSRIVAPTRPEIVQTRGLQWCRLLALTKDIGKGEPAATEPDLAALEAHVDALTGASIYVTRRCLEHIGLMDERYFLYFEDLDWGYRAKHSCGVGHAHKSVVRHHGGTTIGAKPTRAGHSSFSVYLEFRNTVNFVRYHHPAWMGWTLLVLVWRSFRYGMAGSFVNLRIALTGLKAGLASETGRPDHIFAFTGITPSLRKRSE